MATLHNSEGDFLITVRSSGAEYQGGNLLSAVAQIVEHFQEYHGISDHDAAALLRGYLAGLYEVENQLTGNE